MDKPLKPRLLLYVIDARIDTRWHRILAPSEYNVCKSVTENRQNLGLRGDEYRIVPYYEPLTASVN